MFNTSLGIDLGTASVLIYIKGKGVVLKEPSVIAVDKNTSQVVGVGNVAEVMIGRTPPNVSVIKPLRDGVISEYTMTEKMIKAFLAKVIKSTVGKTRIMMCVPSGVTDVEQRAVIETARQMGGKEIFIMSESVAALIGAGIDITKPIGNMIIDVGGGTTDIAVVSVGKIISERSLKIAGNEATEEVIKFIKTKYNLIVGFQTAEHLKKSVGSVFQRDEDVSEVVRGICIVTGLPKAIVISSTELMDCFDTIMHNIIERVNEVLEEISPELQADILRDGITLTGGGVLMYGFEKRIFAETGIEAHIANFPMSCVAKGAGLALEKMTGDEYLKYYKKAYIS